VEGIRERAEEVEDCAEGQFFAYCGGVFHAWMPFAGVEEGVVCFAVDV